MEARGSIGRSVVNSWTKSAETQRLGDMRLYLSAPSLRAEPLL